MKQEFSTSWEASRQVRKQRKFRFNAPLHIRQKFMSAHLSKELRKKYGRRAAPVRKGDEVKVMRGSFADKKAKVADVNLKTLKVQLEGITRQKKDGTKVSVGFSPSILQIVAIETGDKEREKSLSKENKEKKNASN